MASCPPKRLEYGVGNFPEDIDLLLLCSRIADRTGEEFS
jgi:hypothetical protein